MDDEELQRLVLLAVVSGMNFKRSGLNETHITDDMVGDYLKLHDISFEDWKRKINELMKEDIVKIDDDGGYIINEPIY